MSLNIKDPEAHRLAQAIARHTGESMTRVVTTALRQRYAQIERSKARASVEELLAIADRAAAYAVRPTSTTLTSCMTRTACRNDCGHLRARSDPSS